MKKPQWHSGKKASRNFQLCYKVFKYNLPDVLQLTFKGNSKRSKCNQKWPFYSKKSLPFSTKAGGFMIRENWNDQIGDTFFYIPMFEMFYDVPFSLYYVFSLHEMHRKIVNFCELVYAWTLLFRVKYTQLTKSKIDYCVRLLVQFNIEADKNWFGFSISVLYIMSFEVSHKPARYANSV